MTPAVHEWAEEAAMLPAELTVYTETSDGGWEVTHPWLPKVLGRGYTKGDALRVFQVRAEQKLKEGIRG